MPVDIKQYCGLIKIGVFEYMSALYEEGELYFNTFKYFRELECSSDGRGDPNEYLSYYGGNGTKVAIKRKGDKEYTQINDVQFVSMRNNQEEYSHLYCLSSINKSWTYKNKLLISSKNFADGKNYAVIIHNFNEFAKRLKAKLVELKVRAKAGYIDYVSRKEYNGEMGCFKKFEEYSYQNEYRIVACLKNDSVPQTIKIGSLKDIALKPLSQREFESLEIRVEKEGKAI